MSEHSNMLEKLQEEIVELKKRVQEQQEEIELLNEFREQAEMVVRMYTPAFGKRR